MVGLRSQSLAEFGTAYLVCDALAYGLAGVSLYIETWWDPTVRVDPEVPLSVPTLTSTSGMSAHARTSHGAGRVRDAAREWQRIHAPFGGLTRPLDARRAAADVARRGMAARGRGELAREAQH